MTPRHKSTREEKIAFTLRLIGSSAEKGEVFAAVQALKRLLEALGTDLDGLARGFEKILSTGNGADKAITQAELQKAISEAYAAGVQDAENKAHGAHDFLNADGTPAWEAVALFLQRNKHRLPTKNHEFVDKMAAQRSGAESLLLRSTNTCTACSTSSVEKSHERASHRRDGRPPVHRDH